MNLVHGVVPISKAPYRMKILEMNEVNMQLQELIDETYIQPNVSPWDAPVPFIKKIDGSLRLCIDYPQINKMTVKNIYHLSHIDDLFNQVIGETIFSKIDSRSGHHQVRIKYEDIHKITFRTRYDHYDFVVMPFGLTNAPFSFTCLMNSILSKYLDTFVIIFIDDILLYLKNEQEHEEHLRIILQVLREHEIYDKLIKCDIYSDKIPYLGHVISKEVIFVNPDKIKAIMEWPIPKDITYVRYLMGIIGYYQIFIEGLSKIAYSITSL